MLQSFLQRCIGNILSNYIDGLDDLFLGLHLVELRKLSLKENVCAFLGIETLRLERGSISRISFRFPWSAPLTGPIVLEVEGNNISLRPADTGKSDADLLRDLRSSRQAQLEGRAKELTELLRSKPAPERTAPGSPPVPALRIKKICKYVNIENI